MEILIIPPILLECIGYTLRHINVDNFLVEACLYFVILHGILANFSGKFKFNNSFTPFIAIGSTFIYVLVSATVSSKWLIYLVSSISLRLIVKIFQEDNKDNG